MTFEQLKKQLSEGKITQSEFEAKCKELGVDKDRNPLAYGEPLIYGEVLFDAVRDLDFPIVELRPMDESGEETEITYENMNDKVLLAVDYSGE